MRLDISYVQELPNRIAQVRRVICVRVLDVPKSNVITAFRVQTKLGWTDVVAVNAPTGVERLIGSLHIRTMCSTPPFPTKLALGRAHEHAVLMSYASIEGEVGIEARSRLPIFAEHGVFEALVPVIEHIVRLQWLLLIGSFHDRIKATSPRFE